MRLYFILLQLSPHKRNSKPPPREVMFFFLVLSPLIFKFYKDSRNNDKVKSYPSYNNLCHAGAILIYLKYYTVLVSYWHSYCLLYQFLYLIWHDHIKCNLKILLISDYILTLKTFILESCHFQQETAGHYLCPD